ncbi:AAA family ATPase [Candidatus Microgenomates bacterium]|nr:AAA family ATPase [Candidatus Microgenomates bacterium]
MQQTLIILRGAPASGKSTVCEEIQKRKKNIVWFHVDSFKRFLNSRNEVSDRDHWYGAAAASLDYFLNKKFSVLAEGIFQYHKHVNLFIQIAQKHGVKIKIFDFVAHNDILLQRDKTRKGVPEGLRKALAEETIKNLAHEIYNNKFPDAKIIDTEKESIEHIVQKILSEF